MSMLPVYGAIVGQLLSSGDRKRQKALEEQALAEYGQVSLPILKELEERLISSGEWDNLPSDFGNKGLRDEAIARMAEVGRSGGMDAQSQLALEQGRVAAAGQEARGRASVRQEAARRGMGGAGETIGQLYAQQAGAQTASMSGMQAAADARERALRALESGGGMAASAEAQDFGRASKVAGERTAIARYNAEMGRQREMANNAMRQQQYQNQMGLAGAKSGAALTRAGQFGRDAQATRDLWYGLGSSIDETAMNGLGMMMGKPPTGGSRGGFGGGGAPPVAAAPSPYAGSTARSSSGFAPGRNPFDPYDWGY